MKDEHAWTVVGGAFAIADGATTSLLGILNAAGSPYQILVDEMLLMSASLAAVTGVGIEVDLRRISALSSGTAGAIRPMDFSHTLGDESTHVTVATGGTTTAVHVFGYRAVNNDEISLTGQDNVVERVIWSARGKPLVLNAGQGCDIYQVTSSTAGAWIPEMRIRIRRR